MKQAYSDSVLRQASCSVAMKYLVVVLLALAVANVACFTKEQNEILEKNKLACLAKTKVDPKLLLQIKSGDWNVEDKNLKRWVRCLMEKSGVLSENGVFYRDVLLSKVPAEDQPEVDRLVSRCLNTTLRPTELAWQFTKCYHSSNPKYRIF